MARAQSFADKVKKAAQEKVLPRAVRLVYTYKSSQTNAWKFVDRMIHVPEGKSEDEYIDEIIKRRSNH
ncbi:MAG: hypothetical protein ACE5IY_19785 [bacterium]